MRTCFDLDDERDFHFLRRLTTDDELRSALEENPREVLEEHGFDFDPEILPETGVLPTKSEIRRELDEHERERKDEEDEDQDEDEGDDTFDVFSPNYFLQGQTRGKKY